MSRKESWGRYFDYEHDTCMPRWRDERLPSVSVPLLPYGLGRSYGDSCLNKNGCLIDSRQLDHLIHFNPDTGLLRCEAGVSLAQILDLIVPRGWFLPVTPGTKYVTLAGAIANDVHGKNHVSMGTMGCHVTQLELLRSDGSRYICSTTHHPELFAATIGGLGLTGFIAWAELQLIPVANAWIAEESFQCRSLAEMLSRFRESDSGYQYTVAWIDCLAKGKQAGRGIFTRGNHSTDKNLPAERQIRKPRSIPFVFPPNCLNRLTVGLFNQMYYRKLFGSHKTSLMDYDPFFYPLDALHHWNRLYGPRGFIQYQCVLVKDAEAAMKELLERIAVSGQPSPLNVLKEFGDRSSPGMLSFPRKGLTLALDFPNRGDKTLQLCRTLDEVVLQSGGALYPAKDSRMPQAMFEASFPQLTSFRKHIDPAFSSSFWRRVQPA